ncbi:hypothetical protein BC827DRAFT_1155064 [Russula dissimulans]|nr:hypothetical protein BC827DRAFT_1155064 [Russula dissimulans]
MTTEEELLQEQYMSDRQSRQLHLGYSGIHQQERQDREEARRRKLKRALSVTAAVSAPIFIKSSGNTCETTPNARKKKRNKVNRRQGQPPDASFVFAFTSLGFSFLRDEDIFHLIELTFGSHRQPGLARFSSRPLLACGGARDEIKSLSIR